MWCNFVVFGEFIVNKKLIVWKRLLKLVRLQTVNFLFRGFSSTRGPPQPLTPTTPPPQPLRGPGGGGPPLQGPLGLWDKAVFVCPARKTPVLVQCGCIFINSVCVRVQLWLLVDQANAKGAAGYLIHLAELIKPVVLAYDLLEKLDKIKTVCPLL